MLLSEGRILEQSVVDGVFILKGDPTDWSRCNVVGPHPSMFIVGVLPFAVPNGCSVSN